MIPTDHGKPRDHRDRVPHSSLALITLAMVALVGSDTTAAAADGEAASGDRVLTAPGFRGSLLGVEIQAKSLGIVLDVSESMERALPTIQAELKRKASRNPVLHVDGTGIIRPAPDAGVTDGVASDTLTALSVFSEHTTAETVLWITDLADPLNRSGLDALEEFCRDSGPRLLLLSVGAEPPRSLRVIMDAHEGAWHVATAR